MQVGYWNGQKVAVKIIDSNEQESWEQEKDLYLTKLLNHENILGKQVSLHVFGSEILHITDDLII